jgi:hypothetical protein
MEYNGVKIHVWKWLPFAQGFVINSKRFIIKLVKRLSDGAVHIPFTCDLIQHEGQHCKDIKRKGWIDFFATEGWQLVWKKHDLAGYEPDAEKAELLPNPTELEQFVINYCKQNNLLYYY